MSRYVGNLTALETWLRKRRVRKMLREFGALQTCPWCRQCAQDGPDWGFMRWKANVLHDVLTCGVCGGKSIWHFAHGMMFIGSLTPPTHNGRLPPRMRRLRGCGRGWASTPTPRIALLKTVIWPQSHTAKKVASLKMQVLSPANYWRTPMDEIDTDALKVLLITAQASLPGSQGDPGRLAKVIEQAEANHKLSRWQDYVPALLGTNDTLRQQLAEVMAAEEKFGRCYTSQTHR